MWSAGFSPDCETHCVRLAWFKSLRETFVAISRPCVHGGNCPHSRVIEDCDAAQNKEQSSSCPSSVSLHPVRRGSITDHINRGWPKEKLSERVDVSVEVLDKHYDVRTKEQARKNRRQYLED